jgi:hypothetical protein
MDTELKIASDEACRYASELSQLTGQDVASVVIAALKNALDREREIDNEVERMLAFGREIRAHMREPITADLNDLYDETTGLPN